jgi:hypothetical protein
MAPYEKGLFLSELCHLRSKQHKSIGTGRKLHTPFIGKKLYFYKMEAGVAV